MTITFITGANKGLGYETARRLIELGQTVVIGARDPERGQTAADQLGARFVRIDVISDESVARAADDVRGQLDTNVAGVVRVTHAFLPLLRRSEHPAVINVSSGMGSFALTHDPERVESEPTAPLYTASKAAVTMLTTQYAKALPDIRVNAADPGYTATDFNAHSGHQTVTEGTDAIVALATERADAGTGRFIDRSGPVRW